MPVVITDRTNTTWAVEDPSDGLIHVGHIGQAGPKLEDVLGFIDSRKKQFENFVSKKRMKDIEPKVNRRRKRERTNRGDSQKTSTS